MENTTQTLPDPPKYIDMTPTWVECCSMFRAILDGDSTPKGREYAWSEVYRMAGLADKYVAHAKATHAPAAPSEGFGDCAASIKGGIITLDNGTQVNLLDIQATINSAFQNTGDQEYADAASEMSKVTGAWQGPHGEFLAGTYETPWDNDQAFDEGWGMFDGMIQRLDAPVDDEGEPMQPKFNCDAEAREFVRRRAAKGSAYHAEAVTRFMA